jgi:ariadne-1
MVKGEKEIMDSSASTPACIPPTASTKEEEEVEEIEEEETTTPFLKSDAAGDLQDDCSEYSYEYYDEDAFLSVVNKDQHDLKRLVCTPLPPVDRQEHHVNSKRCKGIDPELDTKPSAAEASWYKELSVSETLRHNHNVSKAVQQLVEVPGLYCRACGSENHAPVTACSRVSQWFEERQALPTVSSAMIRCCMDYIVNMVRNKFALSIDRRAARTYCLNHEWALPNLQLEVVENRTAFVMAGDDDYGDNYNDPHTRFYFYNENAYVPYASMQRERPNIEPKAMHANTLKIENSNSVGSCGYEASLEQNCQEIVIIPQDDDQKPAAQLKNNNHDSDDQRNTTAQQMIGNARQLQTSRMSAFKSMKDQSWSAPMVLSQGSSFKETTNPRNTSVSNLSKCFICLEDGFSPDDEMMSMKCGHSFCRLCWYEFIQNMLQEGGNVALRTTCPIPDCQVIVTAGDIERVAPELVPAYEKLELDSFVEAHATCLRQCPGPDCTWVAIIPRCGLFEDAHVLNYCCGNCQTRFCFNCRLPPHDGPCNNAADNHAAVARADAVHHPNHTKDINHIIKQCPKCGIEIQKIGGCNRMHCTACRHFFCWTCLGGYQSYDHVCGKTGPPPRITVADTAFLERALTNATNHLEGDPCVVNEANAVLQKLRYLDRYAHFYNRYFNHHQSQSFAESQCPCLSIAEENYCKMADIRSGADLSFIRQANEVLVASRRLIKYSYCAAFYSKRLDDLDTKNFHLGFLHLEKLERFTEELSEVNENALTRQDRNRVLDLVRFSIVCERVPADAPE